MGRKRKQRSHKKGFTLVETLVALFILTIAIIIPMSTLYIGVARPLEVRDRMIASYLAQDAVEYVQAEIQSKIWRGGRPYLTSLNACSPGYCTVDTINDSLGAASKMLRQDPATGAYGLDNSWDETMYWRQVKVLGGDEDTEIQIEVRVEWGDVGNRRELVVKKNVRTWLNIVVNDEY